MIVSSTSTSSMSESPSNDSIVQEEVRDRRTLRRQFFFTWNAPDNDNSEDWCARNSQMLDQALQAHEAIRAFQWESEQGDQGRWHLQGCMFFKRDVRFNALFTFLLRHGVVAPGRMRVFGLRDVPGSLKYTSKDHLEGKTNVFVSFRTDTLVKQRARSVRSQRSQELEMAVKSCKTTSEVLVKYPGVGIPYHSGIDAYYLATTRLEERGDVKVFWFYGEAGSGKTYAAIKLAEDLARRFDPEVQLYKQPFYMANQNLRWFDNYEGQRVMVIDELRWKSLGEYGIPLLLRILDSHPCRVEVKGGFVGLRAVWILITSQDDPDVTFQHGNPVTGDRSPLENIGQVIRRITKLLHWAGRQDPVDGKYISFYTDVTEQFRRKFCNLGIFGERNPLVVGDLEKALGVDVGGDGHPESETGDPAGEQPVTSTDEAGNSHSGCE